MSRKTNNVELSAAEMLKISMLTQECLVNQIGQKDAEIEKLKAEIISLNSKLEYSEQAKTKQNEKMVSLMSFVLFLLQAVVKLAKEVYNSNPGFFSQQSGRGRQHESGRSQNDTAHKMLQL